MGKPLVFNETLQGTNDKLDKTNELLMGIIGAIENKDIYDQYIVSMLDGTKETYNKVMRAWFYANGVNAVTSEGLTELVDKWYKITRESWSGGTRFHQPSQSSISTGTKTGDNAGKSCTPSTNSVKGQDDYEGLPLFAVKDCNFTYDNSNKKPIITAIEGITDGFERRNPEKNVGVLQMSGFYYADEDDTTYEYGVSSEFEEGHDYCEPYPEAINRIDNTVRSWVLHAKYMNHTVDNKLTSYAGVVPTAYSISQNTLIDRKNSMNNGLTGGCICDYAFIQMMAFVKYGQMTLDGLLQGCVNYNYQYYAAHGETGVKRVLLTASQAANLIEGSTVLVGAYAGNADRAQAAVYSISGNHGFIIKSKETVTVSGVSYVAINLDADEAFDTVGDGSATAGNTIISTFHWVNGSCDNILGNDGSPANPNTGQYAAKLQGIEYSVGGYEVFSDVILSEDTENYAVYITRDASKQSKDSIANYEDTGLRSAKPSAGAWQYIRKLGFKKGVFFGIDTLNASGSTYTRDGFYKDAASTTSLREWLAFGALNSGVGNGGLSYLFGLNGLGFAGWSIVARLSCNGNRGEWTA